MAWFFKRGLVAFIGFLMVSMLGCNNDEHPVVAVTPPLTVSIIEIKPVNTGVDFEFVGFATSSRHIEIRARVAGYLEKQLFHDGAVVKADQPLFQLDKKPFEAALQQARGGVDLYQAQLENAGRNLQRLQPLAAKNAVSQKDLDDAVSRQKSAAAGLLSAQGAVRQAELNLGYATIRSPMSGLAGKALVDEGSYVSPGVNSLLTTITQIDPIRISFDVTENELLQVVHQETRGLLKLPEHDNFSVEAVLADGSVFPHRGSINFADPVFNPKSGSYEVVAELANPQGTLRPGQFVRARLKGAFRPDAILVPQAAVTEGAQGPFVWVVDADRKVQPRFLQLGQWHADRWFVDAGLKAGEQVVVDNIGRLSPGLAVQPTTVEKLAGH